MIGTVQGFSTYLGQPIVDSEMIGRLETALLGAQSFIEIYAGYPLEIHDSVCILDGTGTNYIFIPDFPIVEISKIEYYDENEISWIDYIVENAEVRFRCNNSTGEIKLINNLFFSGFQNIQITHTSGYDFSGFTAPDFKIQGILMALYEVTALFYDNPGLLSFKTVEAGVTKTRFNFKDGSGDSQVIAMLSPEVIITLFSFAKRGVSR